MGIENFCEFVKAIYDNPRRPLIGLTEAEFYALRDHIASCSNCTTLVEEVLDKYKNQDTSTTPLDAGWENARYN